jgi:hypothetical protein
LAAENSHQTRARFKELKVIAVIDVGVGLLSCLTLRLPWIEYLAHLSSFHVSQSVTRIRMKISNVLRFEVFMAVTMKNAVFWEIKSSPYLTGNKLRLRYRTQPVNAM